MPLFDDQQGGSNRRRQAACSKRPLNLVCMRRGISLVGAGTPFRAPPSCTTTTTTLIGNSIGARLVLACLWSNRPRLWVVCDSSVAALFAVVVPISASLSRPPRASCTGTSRQAPGPSALLWPPVTPPPSAPVSLSRRHHVAVASEAGIGVVALITRCSGYHL